MILVLLVAALVFPVPAFIGGVAHFVYVRRAASCAFVCAVAVSAVVSGFQTGPEPDLSRYAAYASSCEGISLADALRLGYGDLPVATMWLWLAGQTGFSFAFPSSVAFVCYFSALYIVFDVARREEFSPFQVVLSVFFLLLAFPLFGVVNAARSSAAFSIGALGLYINAAQGRTRNVGSWVLLIVPGFIHSAGWLVIVLRMLVALFAKSKVASVAVSVLLVPSVLVLSPVLSPITSLLNVDPVEVLTRYSEWTEGYAAVVAASFYNRVLRVAAEAFGVILLLDCLFSRHESDGEKGLFRALRALVILLTGIELSFAVSVIPPSYLRFAYAAAPFVAAYWGCRIFSRRTSVAPGRRVVPVLRFEHVAKAALLAAACALCALYTHNALYYLFPEPFLQALLFGYVGIPLGVL